MSYNKEISIVIVNYNKYQLTEKCIESVVKTIKKVKYEIIVLDNCSTNNSYEKLKKLYENDKNIFIIGNKKNLGFGHGNNIAVKLCRFDNILLLNPDVIVLEESIEKMLNRLLSDKSIGIIGCKLLNGDYTLQYSCRRFLPLNKFILARTPMKKIVSKKIVDKINSQYLMLDYDHKIEKEVDWLMGSCLMLKKKDFLELDGFSKEYFMYFEDVDLAYKIKLKNKKVLYYPDAIMIHLHEQESVKKINKLTFIHIQSMFKFYQKCRNTNVGR